MKEKKILCRIASVLAGRSQNILSIDMSMLAYRNSCITHQVENASEESSSRVTNETTSTSNSSDLV